MAGLVSSASTHFSWRFRQASLMIASAVPSPPVAKAPAKSKTPPRAPVAVQQARAAGFALDLTNGGPDDQDGEFREYVA